MALNPDAMTSDLDWRPLRGCVGRALTALGIFCLMVAAAATEKRYVSWEGMEADKGAAAWYIHRYVAPGALIEFVPYGTPLGEGVLFDVPQARYRRTHNATSLELLLRDFPSSDPTIQSLAHIVHDIEINAWGTKRYPQSAMLENVLKGIADQYPDGNIPLNCFLPLYDNVYRWLARSSSHLDKPPVPRQCARPRI